MVEKRKKDCDYSKIFGWQNHCIELYSLSSKVTSTDQRQGINNHRGCTLENAGKKFYGAPVYKSCNKQTIEYIST